MPVAPVNNQAYHFQTQFHRRWGHLNDPHVRALAWLLDAPDLLEPHAPQWQRKIAAMPGELLDGLDEWLTTLDRKPEELHRYLQMDRFTRLGRYAEKLMAFHFEHRGVLVAHGIQVRAGKNDTIGEFDFLLRIDGRLLHWEFATKFYLLESGGAGKDADHFVGPNLADTLGAKMHKILDRQLLLSEHPAARMHLPAPVSQAQALVKGWLFYHGGDAQEPHAFGISSGHCRGFWRPLADAMDMHAERYAVLPRLDWLVPAKLSLPQTIDEHALQKLLIEHFMHDAMPVLVALLQIEGDVALEVGRGFIVSDDWRTRAGQRIRLTHPSA